jgi:hypothetical protein
MSVFSWRRGKASAHTEPRKVRLELEALEDRLVLSATTTYTVAAGDVATLIADINAANTNGTNTPTTINLTAGTYDFTAPNNNTFGPNALPVVTGNITINGNGAVLERDLSLGQNTQFRFFYVSGNTVANPSSSSQSTGQPTGSLTLENLTLQGGLAQGGKSNTGGGGLGAGGAIFNQGNLTLNGVTVTQNVAEGGNSGTGTAGGGGGMGQDGQSANGGGFNNSGSTSGTFGVGGTGSSTASGGAGGIGGGGGSTTIASTSNANYSGGVGGFGGGGGAGVSLGGAGGFGGGGGAGTTAGAGGFGAGAGNGSAGGGGLGAGGAIFNMYGTTTLINSTLASNLAEGGQGSTVGDGYGGAIFNLDGTLSVTTSTIADNSTTGGVNGGGAVYNLAMGTTSPAAGGSNSAATGVPSTVTLTDSILADSVGSNDLVNDQNTSTAGAAVINATAPNIVMAMSTLDGATTNGTPNTANPQLGLLFNYGGPTATMPLLAGSPALGTGAAGSNVPTTDQRGATRGNVIDLGAVQQTPPEAAATSLALTSSTPANSSGSSITLTATVSANSGSTTPAGTIQFVDTTTGKTLGSVVITVVNSQAQATLTTTAVNSGDKITATFTSSNNMGGSSSNTTVSAASSGTSGSTGANATQVAQWLNAVYEVLLHRPIDPSGLTYWSGVLSNGASRTQVVGDIERTSEYQIDEVQAAYQNLLGTDAPSSAVSYLVGLMQGGTTFQTVEALIVGSGPFYAANGDTTQGFLNAVYQNFLNRPVDPTGMAQWGSLLSAGYSTTQVALGILSTQEYLTVLVQQDYQTYMNRQADPTSLSAYVTALGTGTMNNDMVVASLLGSGEFVSQVTT